jgi:chromosome segregation ATPase
MISLEQLKEQINALPEQLKDALIKQVNARLEVLRLEGQVDKLKSQLEEQHEDEETDDSSEDDDVGLIKLETKLEKLKVKLCEAEDKVELEFRRENPKTTEGYVKATVGNDKEVNRLKLEIIDIKEEARIKKVTLQRERKAARENRMQALLAARNKIEPESEELNALQDSLDEASSKAMMAEVEVETLKAKLDTYKLLVQLEGI